MGDQHKAGDVIVLPIGDEIPADVKVSAKLRYGKFDIQVIRKIPGNRKQPESIEARVLSVMK